MIKLIQLLSLLLLLNACASLQEPEFRSSEGFKLEKMEGKEIRFSVGAKVYNPNWFGIKIKPSNVEVYVDGQLMGVVHLEKKVKMKAKRESTLNLQLLATLEDGAWITMMKNANRENVEVRIKGKVKGGVFIFSKKIEIDETKTVSGKDLKLGMPR